MKNFVKFFFALMAFFCIDFLFTEDSFALSLPANSDYFDAVQNVSSGERFSGANFNQTGYRCNSSNYILSYGYNIYCTVSSSNFFYLELLQSDNVFFAEYFDFLFVHFDFVVSGESASDPFFFSYYLGRSFFYIEENYFLIDYDLVDTCSPLFSSSLDGFGRWPVCSISVDAYYAFEEDYDFSQSFVNYGSTSLGVIDNPYLLSFVNFSSQKIKIELSAYPYFATLSVVDSSGSGSGSGSSDEVDAFDEAQQQAEDVANSASSDVDSATTTVVGELSSFVEGLGSVSGDSCVFDTSSLHNFVGVDSVDLCALDPPSEFSTITGLILVVVVVPIWFWMLYTVISMFVGWFGGGGQQLTDKGG